MPHGLWTGQYECRCCACKSNLQLGISTLAESWEGAACHAAGGRLMPSCDVSIVAEGIQLPGPIKGRCCIMPEGMRI